MDLGGVILSRKIRQFTHWNVRDLVRVGPPTTKSRKAVSDSSARIRARLMASGLYPELK
jgi:hypothetical protein